MTRFIRTINGFSLGKRLNRMIEHLLSEGYEFLPNLLQRGMNRNVTNFPTGLWIRDKSLKPEVDNQHRAPSPNNVGAWDRLRSYDADC